MKTTGTNALALLAGCVTGEELTLRSEVDPLAEDAAPDRLQRGDHGEGLEVRRLRQTELFGGLDGGVASATGSRVHLSMRDITCAMTRSGTVDYDEDVEEDEPEEIGDGSVTLWEIARP